MNLEKSTNTESPSSVVTLNGEVSWRVPDGRLAPVFMVLDSFGSRIGDRSSQHRPKHLDVFVLNGALNALVDGEISHGRMREIIWQWLFGEDYFLPPPRGEN